MGRPHRGMTSDSHSVDRDCLDSPKKLLGVSVLGGNPRFAAALRIGPLLVRDKSELGRRGHVPVEAMQVLSRAKVVKQTSGTLRICQDCRIGQSGQVIIREPTLDDYAQWLILWDGYNAFYGRHGPRALPSEITQTTWQRFFDPHEPVHALIAELNDRLIGLAHFLFHRSTISLAPTCYLQDLFTSEEARGRGIASALIGAIAEEARTQGSVGLYWQTHETNARARALYDRIAERSGFIVYRMALNPPPA